MSDYAAALELERQLSYSRAAWLQRAGWQVGRHALQPMRRQPAPIKPRGILAALARMLGR